MPIDGHKACLRLSRAPGAWACIARQAPSDMLLPGLKDPAQANLTTSPHNRFNIVTHSQNVIPCHGVHGRGQGQIEVLVSCQAISQEGFGLERQSNPWNTSGTYSKTVVPFKDHPKAKHFASSQLFHALLQPPASSASSEVPRRPSLRTSRDNRELQNIFAMSANTNSTSDE